MSAPTPPPVGSFWREKARPERIVEVVPFQAWQPRDVERVTIKSRTIANARKQVFPSAVLLSTRSGTASSRLTRLLAS